MKYELKAVYMDRGERFSQKTNKTYYAIMVKQGMETANLGVSAEWYTAAAQLSLGQEVVFNVHPSVRSGGTGSFLSLYCDSFTVVDGGKK